MNANDRLKLVAYVVEVRKYLEKVNAEILSLDPIIDYDEENISSISRQAFSHQK